MNCNVTVDRLYQFDGNVFVRLSQRLSFIVLWHKKYYVRLGVLHYYFLFRIIYINISYIIRLVNFFGI